MIKCFFQIYLSQFLLDLQILHNIKVSFGIILINNIMKTKIIPKIFLVLFFIGIILLEVQAQSDLYKLVLLSQERGASCLDGSPPAIYVHQGKGENKNNYLLYFEGGGFCGQPTLQATIDSCYKRSFTDLGSSKNLSATMNGMGLGALSPSQEQNPLFYDWTKVGVKYCDGHEYVGHRQSPIQYKQRNIYFRGSRNVKQVFNYMSEKYDFYNGGKIVIGGGSAGGMCAYQWSNYLFEHTKKAKVFSTPDSGFFITDYESPVYGTKILRAYAEPLMSLVYNQTQTPQPIVKCINEADFDVVDCLNVANYAKYLKAPLFIIQSPYDYWSVRNILGVSCPTNKQEPYSIQNCNATVRAAIEDYRTKSISYLKSMRNGKRNVGIWGPACVQHSFEHMSKSYNSQKYKVQGVTLMKAIEAFLKNPEEAPWLLDQIPWPENTGCNGLTSLRVD